MTEAYPHAYTHACTNVYNRAIDASVQKKDSTMNIRADIHATVSRQTSMPNADAHVYTPMH